MRILLTGSTGFLGKALVNELVKTDVKLIKIGRDSDKKNNHNYIYTEGVDSGSQFNLGIHKCEIAIHCAARVHVMNDSSSKNPLEDFREVNAYGTLNLARQAADAGVKRFVFISSIKVNGESTESGFPFKPNDSIVPSDPYGLSKYEAEVGLKKISKNTGMEVIIIRPPLVYGPYVKANFYNLMKLAKTGIPLPFGAIHNLRSMLYVGNLVDFIVTCINHPAAKNQTFLLSDGYDLSLTELLCLLRSSMGISARLFPVPASLFRIAGLVTGKRAVVDRLVGSLQIDTSKACDLLNWQPPYTVEQGIKATTDHFLQGEK